MRKNHLKRKNTKGGICLLVCLSVLLTSCAASDKDNIPQENSTSNVAKAQEWVYVPERIVIKDDKADYDKMNLIGDTVCYVSMNGESGEEVKNVCQYSLSDRKLTSAPIEWPMEGSHRDVVTYCFNPDCSVWLIVNVYPSDFSKMSRFLCRFDPDGKCSLFQDVTEQLGSGISMSCMALDEQGRIYIFSNEYSDLAGVWLYTADGSYYGTVSYGSSENVWVRKAISGEDGRIYACISKGENPEHCTLAEVDFEKKQLIEVIEDFPNVNGLNIGAGVAVSGVGVSGEVSEGMAENRTKQSDASDKQYDFLLYDDECAYGYDFTEKKGSSGQAAEKLFLWMDSNINGYFVTDLRLLKDGRYYAVVEDWASEDRSIVLLTKTRAEDVPEQENLVLATVNGESDLVGMAMRFNRENYPYHITVKNYASLTDLYHAMLTKETMDIIDLSSVDAKMLSRQGILADLNPYVERSSAFGRSDFLDGILNVYEFDGMLAGIPEIFRLQTVVGDGTKFGKGGGLTLEELLAAVSNNPQTVPFDGITKDEMMQYIMMFNEDTFIDWNTGDCCFDSDTFNAVLELCGRFPDGDRDNKQNGYDSEELPLSDKIRNGEVLFAITDIFGFKSLQPYMGIFGEAGSCIGFPTKEGGDGNLLFPYNAFGIASVSECKEGAWKFIESILTRDRNPNIWFGYFPVMKEDMNRIVEDEMNDDAERIARGRGLRSYYWSDDFAVPYHATTWEEVNDMLALVAQAIPYYQVADNEIIKIISEEAEAYYRGQKSAEAVAGIIQSRVQLYVRENF